jgi:hypothetical protein
MPVMSAERQKQEARERLLESLTAYHDRGLRLMKETEKRLGPDDPVYGEISRMMEGSALAVEQVGDLVEKGKCLEKITANDTG